MKFLSGLVSRHRADPTIPKLSILVAGGGVAIAELLKIPGASALVQGINFPYAVEETARFIDRNLGPDAGEEFRKKSVDGLAAVNLAGALRNHGEKLNGFRNTTYVAVTAAVTTDRYRRGDNSAHIAIYRAVPLAGFLRTSPHRLETYHLRLAKLKEEQYQDIPEYVQWLVQNTRNDEDRKIAKVALLLAETPDSDEIEEMISNGTLTGL